MTASVGAGLVFLSGRALSQPREAALAFGVALPQSAEPTPYLQVKADRDLTLGALLLVVVRYADDKTLASVMLCGAIGPLCDAAIVATHGDRKDTAVHLVTAAFILGAAWLAGTGR